MLEALDRLAFGLFAKFGDLLVTVKGMALIVSGTFRQKVSNRFPPGDAPGTMAERRIGLRVVRPLATFLLLLVAQKVPLVSDNNTCAQRTRSERSHFFLAPCRRRPAVPSDSPSGRWLPQERPGRA